MSLMKRKQDFNLFALDLLPNKKGVIRRFMGEKKREKSPKKKKGISFSKFSDLHLGNKLGCCYQHLVTVFTTVHIVVSITLFYLYRSVGLFCQHLVSVRPGYFSCCQHLDSVVRKFCLYNSVRCHQHLVYTSYNKLPLASCHCLYNSTPCCQHLVILCAHKITNVVSICCYAC